MARLGAVVTPVLPIHRERELGFVLREAGARVLIAPGRLRDCDHRELARAVRGDAPALAHVVVVRDEPGPGAHGWDTLLRSSGAPPPRPLGAQGLAPLLSSPG